MREGLILILADGVWNDDRRLDRLVSEADRTIATDGAFDKALYRGIRVDEVVGDLDSLTPSGRERLAASPIPVHVYPRAKDKTDLELAIDLALSCKPGRIVVYGGTGGRLDQTIANLLLLLKGIPAGIPIEIVSGAEVVRAVVDRIEIEGTRIGDTVSLIPISRRAVVRTVGLLYPLNGEKLVRGSSRGISNEVVSLPATVEVEEGVLIVVQRGRSG